MPFRYYRILLMYFEYSYIGYFEARHLNKIVNEIAWTRKRAEEIIIKKHNKLIAIINDLFPRKTVKSTSPVKRNHRYGRK